MNAQQEIARKNAEQIREHERRFGKLGQPQTKKQKQSLRSAVAELVVGTCPVCTEPVLIGQDRSGPHRSQKDGYQWSHAGCTG